MLIALILTIVSEGIVTYILTKSKTWLKLNLYCNLLTNPLLNLILALTGFLGKYIESTQYRMFISYYLPLVILEIIVFGVEGHLYWLMGADSKRTCYRVSFITNCFSIAVGVVYVFIYDNMGRKGFEMSVGMIIGAVIISIVAAIMITFGICQMLKKDGPVGFYNVIAPPKSEEISDIMQWNKKHGMIWIIYGICIELGFWFGCFMPYEILEMVFMMGGVVLPLPFMVMRHHKLEKQYKVQ